MTAALNGKPVLRFTSDVLETGAAAPDTDAASVLMVAKVTTATSYGMLLCYGQNTAGTWNFGESADTGKLNLRNGQNNAGPLSDASLQGQGFKLLEGSFTAGDAWRIWENGVLKASNTVSFLQINGYAFDMAGRAGAYFLDGDIAEVMVYNRALSSNEQAQAGRYLADKYGIQTLYPALPTRGTVIEMR